MVRVVGGLLDRAGGGDGACFLVRPCFSGRNTIGGREERVVKVKQQHISTQMVVAVILDGNSCVRQEVASLASCFFLSCEDKGRR